MLCILLVRRALSVCDARYHTNFCSCVSEDELHCFWTRGEEPFDPTGFLKDHRSYTDIDIFIMKDPDRITTELKLTPGDLNRFRNTFLGYNYRSLRLQSVACGRLPRCV